MTPDEKAAAVVSKLTRLTQEGKLTWSKTRPVQDPTGPNDVLRSYYEARFQGRTLGIFEARSPFWYDSDVSDLAYKSYVGLVALDDKGGLDWSFPDVVGLQELLDAVQYKAGNIGDLLDELLEADKQPTR